MKHLSILAFLLLKTIAVFSQNNCWSASLHEGNIRSMVERGTSVWLGTEFALVEIDRTSRQILNRFDRQNSPLDGPITALALDTAQNLLVGTEKLRGFDGSTWTEKYAGNFAIRDILAHDSLIWLATANGLVKLAGSLAPKIFTKANQPLLPSNWMNQIRRDTAGNYWLAVGQNFSAGGLMKIPKTGSIWKKFDATNAPFPSLTAVRDLTFEDDGHLLLAVADRVMRLEIDSLKWSNFDPTPSGGDFYTFSLAKKTGGELVVGMEKSLAIRAANGTWTSHPLPGQFDANSFIFNVLADADGQIWAGSNTNGLAIFTANSPEIVNTNLTQLPLSPATALGESPAGKIWAGSAFGGILSLENDWQLDPQFFTEQSTNQTLDIQFDTDGSPLILKTGLWQQWSVQRWNGSEFVQLFSDFSGFSGKRRLRKSGDAWYVSCTRGLFQWKNNALTKFDTSNSAISTNFLFDMDVDAAGTLWMTTANKGLLTFDGTSFGRIDSATNGLPSDSLLAVEIAPDQTIWFSDAKGNLLHIGATGLEKFNDPTPPADHRITELEADPNGSIWLNNERGITRFDGSVWLPFTAENSSIQPGEGPPRAILVTDEAIWAGMNFGIYRLDQACLPPVSSREIGVENWPVSVFPNPTSDRVLVSFFIEKGNDASMQVIDFIGRTVISEPGQHFAAGENQVEIDLAHLPAGLYFLHLKTADGKLAVAKILKT